MNPPGDMIVVHMLGSRPPTDRAPSALIGQHPPKLGHPDLVPPPQVVLTATAMETLSGLAAARVMAALAIRPMAFLS
jgi:hypothetical protein